MNFEQIDWIIFLNSFINFSWQMHGHTNISTKQYSLRIIGYFRKLLIKCSIIIFTNPSARAGYDTRSIFKRSLTGLNSEFSFSYISCLTKAEEPSLPYYLPIAGGKIIGFIPFPRILVLCEMQLASSRIWTRVAVAISYDDNHYTMGKYSIIPNMILLGCLEVGVIFNQIPTNQRSKLPNK